MRLWCALLSLFLVACHTEGDREGGFLSPTEGEGEASVRGPRAQALLAARAGRVLWFEVRTHDPEDPPREAALFAVRGAEGTVYYESLGLGAPQGGSLRFLVRRGELWVVPAAEAGQRAQQRIYDEREGGGQRERVETPAGSFQARRFSHVDGRVALRYWFAVDVGLVRFEVRIDDKPALELLRAKTSRWGRNDPYGYPAQTPDECWTSLERALHALDLAALRGLIGDELWQRLRPAGDLGLLGETQRQSDREEAQRIRAVVPQLLDVRFEPLGPWQIVEFRPAKPGEPPARRPEARAPARIVASLDGQLLVDRAKLVLRQHDQGWEWIGFERQK